MSLSVVIASSNCKLGRQGTFFWVVDLTPAPGTIPSSPSLFPPWPPAQIPLPVLQILFPLLPTSCPRNSSIGRRPMPFSFLLLYLSRSLMEMVGRYMMQQRSKQLRRVMNSLHPVRLPRASVPTCPGTRGRIHLRVSHLQPVP